MLYFLVMIKRLLQQNLFELQAIMPSYRQLSNFTISLLFGALALPLKVIWITLL